MSPIAMLLFVAAAPGEAAVTAAAEPVPAVTAPVEAPANPPAPDAPHSADTGIVVSATRPTKADPLAELNGEMFAVTQRVDESVVAPIAFTYAKAVPSPVRAGLRNALHNLKSPVLAANNVLQFKPVGTAKVVARFLINTTLGLGGLIDVAAKKPFNMPYINNGFGYTLRDALGGMVDAGVNPSLVGAPLNSPYYTVGAGTVRSLDFRIEFDDKLKEFNASSNAYVTEREWYLKTRQDEIDALRGRKPAEAPPATPPAK
jgi:phospholipid-binding lipoprotein MlaA